MYSVRQILGNKGTDVWAIAPNSSIYDALKLMDEKDIGAVLVMDGNRLVGIFSERDYARKVILRGKSSKETQVKEVMTPRVLTVRPETTSEECMALMTDKHIRHLPVMEGDRVAGVISIGDVVKAIISKQAFEIEQLGNYISGER
jgi:CBS domain-containing protein